MKHLRLWLIFGVMLLAVLFGAPLLTNLGSVPLQAAPVAQETNAPTCHVYTGGGDTIPDGNQAGRYSNIQVTNAGYIQAVTVTLTIDHSDWSELEGYLCRPNGCYTTLFSRNETGTGVRTLTFNDLTFPPMAGINAQNMRTTGRWRLWIVDPVSGGGHGELLNWSLGLCSTPAKSTVTATPTLSVTVTATPTGFDTRCLDYVRVYPMKRGTDIPLGEGTFLNGYAWDYMPFHATPGAVPTVVNANGARWYYQDSITSPSDYNAGQPNYSEQVLFFGWQVPISFTVQSETSGAGNSSLTNIAMEQEWPWVYPSIPNAPLWHYQGQDFFSYPLSRVDNYSYCCPAYDEYGHCDYPADATYNQWQYDLPPNSEYLATPVAASRRYDQVGYGIWDKGAIESDISIGWGGNCGTGSAGWTQEFVLKGCTLPVTVTPTPVPTPGAVCEPVNNFWWWMW